MVVARCYAEQSLFHSPVHHLFGLDKVSRPYHFGAVVSLLKDDNVVGLQFLKAFYRCLAFGVGNHDLVSCQLGLAVIHSRDMVGGSRDDEVSLIAVESPVGFHSCCHINMVGDAQVGKNLGCHLYVESVGVAVFITVFKRVELRFAYQCQRCLRAVFSLVVLGGNHKTAADENHQDGCSCHLHILAMRFCRHHISYE